jgi:hypothetical protein
MSADGQTMLASVIGGHLYKSVDGGVNWSQEEPSRQWRGVACSSDGSRLLACDNGGKIYTYS